jgi:hypothetical protein
VPEDEERPNLSGPLRGTPEDSSTPAERFQEAVRLHHLGVAMKRQSFRRERPEATEEELDAAVLAWLADRPDAPYGDGDGVPGTWPRRRTGG